MNKERYQMVDLVRNKLMNTSDTLMTLAQQEGSEYGKESDTKNVELIYQAHGLILAACYYLEQIEY